MSNICRHMNSFDQLSHPKSCILVLADSDLFAVANWPMQHQLKLPQPVTQKAQWQWSWMQTKFQSQPCLTIHYTCNEILEGLS
eukprot:scaffold12282_cov75-Cyclotella_meneghiniana.AAC.1